jgi:hypothetical protein
MHTDDSSRLAFTEAERARIATHHDHIADQLEAAARQARDEGDDLSADITLELAHDERDLANASRTHL